MAELTPTIRRLGHDWLRRHTLSVSAVQLAESALVFAPHPDDETLGCGGTIARKRHAGSDLRIVFMTDGGGSHPRLMAAERLRAIRRAEALAAAGILGVEAERVRFLDFPDGTLAAREAEATARVRELLIRHRPAQVYVPFHADAPEDHRATYRIVRAALRDSRWPSSIWQYPVAFWRHWPWVANTHGLRQRLGLWQRSLRAAGGVRLLHALNYRTAIDEVLPLKRRALDAHASQMRRLLPDPGWVTLADLHDGEFLDCFLREHEFFVRTP